MGRKTRGRAIVFGLFISSLITGLAVPEPADAGQAVAECPDPAMLIDQPPQPAVTLMCTGGGIPTRSAPSLTGLSDVRPHAAFAPGGRPGWAGGGFWAPDLEHVGGQYLLYYSARLGSTRRHCIGLAVSDRPDGGFRDIGVPLVDERSESTIDPALLSVGDQLVLFYKRSRNAAGAPSFIVGRLLSPDGLTVVGPEVELLRSKPRGWEHRVVEGPAPIQFGDTTYLLYSEGRYYLRGYAEGEAERTGDPLGPYTRVSTAPVLRGNAHWAGTGGGSIVLDGSQMLLAYAAFRPGPKKLRRLLFIRELVFADGAVRPTGSTQQIRLRGP
jgi:beta-xylosidase